MGDDVILGCKQPGRRVHFDTNSLTRPNWLYRRNGPIRLHGWLPPLRLSFNLEGIEPCSGIHSVVIQVARLLDGDALRVPTGNTSETVKQFRKLPDQPRRG